ncbi:MAG TPA: DUF4405 domain-containing protein [Rhodocyclaceae bacterium]|jgi:hypothetical protein
MTLREWATPLTIGSFILIAVTGVLMFFHLNTGLNKPAHEWLSWILLVGVSLHGAANFGAFKRYFEKRGAMTIIGISVVVLALSFLPLGGGRGGKPAQMKATDALLDAPVSLVAQVAGKDVQTLLNQLNEAGIHAAADKSLRQGTADREQQMRALGLVFEK